MPGAATYGSSDVARAAGVNRATFDGWLLRRYLPLQEQPPGTGRARKYSLLDAVRAAAMAHMTSIGVLPGRAAAAIVAIERESQPGDTLVLTADPITGRALAGVVYSGAVGEFVSRLGVHDAAGARVPLPGHYQLDLFEMSAQVQRSLQDPAWRPDLAAVDTREYEALVVLHMTTPPATKRRTRKTKAKVAGDDA
jgi:hypothetical protein